jgi:L-fuculose-phosphate aldolase
MDAIELDVVREAIVAAGRRLASRGLIAAGEGNLSVRLPDGLFLITPSGRRKDELATGDMIVVGTDGAARPRSDSLRPSSDLALHLAVYHARPDVVAYVHAHIASAMALTLAGEIPEPAQLPETALFIPRLPMVPLATPGSPELARSLAAALSAPPDPLPGAVLLERHGAVAVGSLEAGDDGALTAATATGSTAASLAAALKLAVDRLELVDVLCRVWLDATLLRATRQSAVRRG